MTIVPYEIPLSPQPQVFSIGLGSKTYRLTLSWNDAPSGGWVLDIADNNDAPLINGIPLVTGSDLLAQYEYVGMNGAIIVETDYDLNVVPTFSNLGVQSHVFFLVEDGT